MQVESQSRSGQGHGGESRWKSEYEVSHLLSTSRQQNALSLASSSGRSTPRVAHFLYSSIDFAPSFPGDIECHHPERQPTFGHYKGLACASKSPLRTFNQNVLDSLRKETPHRNEQWITAPLPRCVQLPMRMRTQVVDFRSWF